MDPERSPRRWLMLSAYCFLSISCLASCYSFSSISNIIQKFYNQNLIAVNYLALVYPIVCLVLMLPLSYVSDNYGIRITLITAAFFNLLGCCVKYGGYALHLQGFWFLLAGNVCCGIAASATLFLPPKIAGLWFGAKERAKATSIAVAADSIGLAIGYMQPPAMVQNSDVHENILNDLGYYLLALTCQATLTFFFVVAVIRDRPKPSLSRSASAQSIPLAEITSNDPTDQVAINISSPSTSSHLIEYKNLLKNCSYHIVMHTNGVLYGTESVWLVTLNEMLIKRFPGYEVQIGSMGAVGLITSVFSNFLVGILLDRTKRFKRITMITTGINLLCVIIFTILFKFTSSFITFFILYVAIAAIFTSYYTTSFDHCAEITYPISEAKSGVLLLYTAQIYDVVLASIASRIIISFGAFVLMYFLIGLYFVTFILSLVTADKGPRTAMMSRNYQSDNT